MSWSTLLLLAGLTFVGWVATLVVLRLTARRPAHLGLHDGRLSPCPSSPNCVSSQADGATSRCAPLAFQGSVSEAREQLRRVISGFRGARVVVADGCYLHAEFTTRLFRFVDDVEFAIDEQAQVIHVRSASRVGWSDLGVNRARVEAIRKALAGGDRNART